MRKIIIITILSVFIIIGAGCWNTSNQTTNPPNPPTDSQEPDWQLVNLTGVIKEITSDQSELILTLVDQSEEIIDISQNVSLTSSVGELVKIEGKRDPSTRIIVADNITETSEQNIVVLSPKSGSIISSPLIVEGFARVFENTVNWRIKNNRDQEVASGVDLSLAKEAGYFGPFRLEIFLPPLSHQDFILEVLTFSARDGSAQDIVSIPLRLVSLETSSFNVFFPNQRLTTQNQDVCTTVFPVNREIAQTSAIARAALVELLKGPTPSEQNSGYTTSIPLYSFLKSISIQNGVATVDFSQDLSNTAGSCNIASIETQIEKTLLQFSSVQEVRLLVEGQENMLNP